MYIKVHLKQNPHKLRELIELTNTDVVMGKNEEKEVSIKDQYLVAKNLNFISYILYVFVYDFIYCCGYTLVSLNLVFFEH